MNKLTLENLLSYRLTHPQGSLVEVARNHGVSKQYAWELWNKHFPGKSFNESWGVRIERSCKACGKTFHAYEKLISKGHAKFCSQACYLNTSKIA